MRAHSEAVLDIVESTPGHERRASLLVGTIGVGIALLAAISELEPAWDRLLLCDLPVI